MGFGTGFLNGFVISIFVTGLSMLGAVRYYAAEGGKDWSKDWVLKSVPVAAKPLAAGALASPSDFDVREVAEQFANGAIPPLQLNKFYGTKLQAKMVEGEVLTPGHFERRRYGRICVHVAKETARSAGAFNDPAVQRTLSTLDQSADGLDSK